MAVEFKDISGIITDSPFTDNQLRAVTEDGFMIVSAGAGSGKTTVMIARIINKLVRGARLDDMLIVTFTRASAADMRVKLAEKLVKLKTDENAPSAARLAAADAIDAMSVANIGTLHSYCQKLIKSYFYAAQIDPSATVGPRRARRRRLNARRARRRLLPRGLTATNILRLCTTHCAGAEATTGL